MLKDVHFFVVESLTIPEAQQHFQDIMSKQATCWMQVIRDGFADAPAVKMEELKRVLIDISSVYKQFSSGEVIVVEKLLQIVREKFPPVLVRPAAVDPKVVASILREVEDKDDLIMSQTTQVT